eukprot:CAMPEP_0117423044 /NCGR_PEP_ID=MMETSP0758-20121206/3764_1 /TAXON_ID=63605 /ORGANISM="Percolomonas cosmopolitus, Strain AE-1 (ATCC 50343)" /LENGTH=400 /DNA_ID=CAMNT_0005206031 /DNA_START=113 /DNA_END=1312 /DNA_ORIENTATION=-
MSLNYQRQKDFQKRKDLEEARKAGRIPAEVDEEGRDINPHLPNYITQAPFYVAQDVPSMKHQYFTNEEKKKQPKIGFNDRFKRGGSLLASKKKATHYRRGACKNCGATGHKAKDCLDRPRRRGAKITGKVSSHDYKKAEYDERELTYDASRDSWANYDPSSYLNTVDKFKKIEAARSKMRVDELKRRLNDATTEEEREHILTTGIKDEDKTIDVVPEDGKVKSTIRNLRQRENIAKYLRNLDPNSAYYDAKTRSMRENPNPNVDPAELEYAGDNFTRYSGDFKDFAEQQKYAYQAFEEGKTDVHFQATPTAAERLHRSFKESKQKELAEAKLRITKKYGQTGFQKPLHRSNQSLSYQKYAPTGQLLPSDTIMFPSSKYEEDIFLANHTSIFGSYWKDGKW